MKRRSSSSEMPPDNVGRLLKLMESECKDELTECSISSFLRQTGLTAEVISSDFLPFRNSGYMPYSLMLRILLEKDGRNITRLLSDSFGFVPCDALICLYEAGLYDRAWVLSEEDIFDLCVEELYSHYEFGIVSSLFGKIPCDLCIGSCAIDSSNHDELQVKLCFGKRNVYPEFIKFTQKAEMERVIRMIMLKKCSVELTGSRPEYNEDGIYAVRPPKGNWGMRIMLREDRTWGK